MEIGNCLALPVSDQSHVPEVRRYSQQFATAAEFDETQAGKLAIIATEAATNLLKHAGDGEIIFQILRCGEVNGIEMLALDKGPGMQNPAACLQDGFTTAGTPGSGLGAIKRQADEFEIYSLPGKGTIICARLWKGVLTPIPANQISCHGLAIPMASETVCGDSWACKTVQNYTYVLVCDGLGHGPLAAEAAATAKRIFLQRDITSVAVMLKEIHLALKGTRGAAVALCAIDTAKHTILYGGVGNISGVILQDSHMKHMISVNGTMGHTASRFQEFSYDFPPGACIVMYSDGLQSKWTLQDYPGIWHRHDGILPALLYRDHSRRRDDTTVVVIKQSA